MNIVSASLNQLPDGTSANSIKSLATTAFNAESDEDAQNSVLAAAAGSAGSVLNTKIVQNTPTVLKELKAIMQSPIAATVKSNAATIQNSRSADRRAERVALISIEIRIFCQVYAAFQLGFESSRVNDDTAEVFCDWAQLSGGM